jgi:hypothetical protein
MSDARENLIEDLVADLRPVKRPGRFGFGLAVWLIVALLYNGLIVLATGPLRAGAVRDVIDFPMFAGETLLALLAIVTLAHATLETAVPGRGSRIRHFFWPLVFVGLWAAVYVVGLWYPAHPVSMLGKREHCVWQTVLFTLPSLALLLWIARRQLPLWPRTTAMLAGAAAAAIPAALMQFACMYVPAHILTHHIGPIAVMTGFGALVGKAALTTRMTVPRSRGVSIH